MAGRQHNTYNFPTRLGWGKGVVGPDYPGCVNSGAAPCLLKSKSSAKALGKPFIVGGMYPIEFELAKCIIAMIQGKKTPNMKRYRVRFFKTYSGAKNYFLKLARDIENAYKDPEWDKPNVI